jgi:hypothetical protein
MYAHVAAADDKRVCIDAYARAQQLRQQMMLRASREQLLVCAQDRCPDLARSDCIKWLREVDDAIPTVVARARDAHGFDLPDVRVFLDGKLLANRLDGRPLRVDPGEHMLRFERTDVPVVEQTLVAMVGEKNRIVSVTFPEETGAATSQERSAPTTPPGASVPAGILAGVGIVAAGISAYLELQGIGDRRRLFDTCAGNCSQSDVNFAYRELRAGDIAGGVAVVALAGALWIVLTNRGK